MKAANNIIETHGSITKNEILIPIQDKILEGTCVSEAVDAYANYYGESPHLSNLETLYFFTKRFYSLEEVLKFTCNIENFLESSRRYRVATSVLDFSDHYHYALRIKAFPDYGHIHWLQTFYGSEGVAFCRKVHLLKLAEVTTFKQFRLEKLHEGIYLDKSNKHKAYIDISRQVNEIEFINVLASIRNNTNCVLFDAALGTIYIDTRLINIVRIYSENLNAALLRSIKKQFIKVLLNKELIAH